jgi:hypothetical protein
MATPKAPLASRAMIDHVMAGDHNLDERRTARPDSAAATAERGAGAS